MKVNVKLSDYEKESINKLAQSITKGMWSKDGLVQIIELCGNLCNLMTISDYSKIHNISYNGVKNHREIIELFNVKFVKE